MSQFTQGSYEPGEQAARQDTHMPERQVGTTQDTLHGSATVISFQKFTISSFKRKSSRLCYRKFLLFGDNRAPPYKKTSKLISTVLTGYLIRVSAQNR